MDQKLDTADKAFAIITEHIEKQPLSPKMLHIRPDILSIKTYAYFSELKEKKQPFREQCLLYVDRHWVGLDITGKGDNTLSIVFLDAAYSLKKWFIFALKSAK